MANRVVPTVNDIPLHGFRPYSDFHLERIRAHAKHDNKSLEQDVWTNARFLRVLLEEAGEVARAFNEYELGNISFAELKHQARTELVQCGAMVAAWVDAIDGDFPRDDRGRRICEICGDEFAYCGGDHARK